MPDLKLSDILLIDLIKKPKKNLLQSETEVNFIQFLSKIYPIKTLNWYARDH